MNIIRIILIIIVAYILDFLIKRYPKVSIVLITTLLLILIVDIDCVLFMTINTVEMVVETSIISKLIIIIISIVPIICIKEYIEHTIRIVDFCINKNKLLKMGNIEKGTIQEIKSYGFSHHVRHGYYLIVDLNGEKIKSIPFRYPEVGEDSEDISRLYNIGDKIDVIIYNNKKYVKLKEYE